MEDIRTHDWNHDTLRPQKPAHPESENREQYELGEVDPQPERGLVPLLAYLFQLRTAIVVSTPESCIMQVLIPTFLVGSL